MSNHSRKKLVLSTEVLRTLVIGGAGGAVQAPAPERKTIAVGCAPQAGVAQPPAMVAVSSCGIVCF